MRWSRSKTSFGILMVFLVAFAGFLGWHALQPVSDRPDLPQPGAISQTSGVDSSLPAEGSPPPGAYEQQDYNSLRVLFVLALIGFSSAGWYMSQRHEHA
jgi:hypothetical protein